MKLCLYTNVVSPHQMPLAKELVKLLGEENYRYIYNQPFLKERRIMGWRNEGEHWILDENGQGKEAEEWLESADVLFSGNRDLNLFERRSRRGLKTFYFSERWFKPFVLSCLWVSFSVPGWMRLLSPTRWIMARRISRLLAVDPNFIYFPMGVHAEADMRMILSLFGESPINQMRLWGYCVEKGGRIQRPLRRPVRLLCVGRQIFLKRFDTVIRAVKVLLDNHVNVSLTMIGDGREAVRLKRMAKDLPVRFVGFIPIDRVRKEMQEHDVLIFSSNAQDGWGAVVNEALEEGLRVVSTAETGAGATILPPKMLYHCGSVKELVAAIQYVVSVPPIGIGSWSVEERAKMLVEEARR